MAHDAARPLSTPDDPQIPSGAVAEVSALLQLLARPAEWVERTTETIEILDASTVRRSVTFDLHLPELVLAADSADPRRVTTETRRPLPFVPVTLLDKRILRSFDLRSRSGDAVSMMSIRRNARYSGWVLMLAAEDLLRAQGVIAHSERVPDAVGRRLHDFAGQPRDKARELLNQWLDGPGRFDTSYSAVWTALANDRGFVDFVRLLASSFLLAVEESASAGRAIYKMTFEESLSRWGSSWSTRWGLEPQLVALECPACTLCSSYHVEVVAPRDMEIVDAYMCVNPQTHPGAGTGVNPPLAYTLLNLERVETLTAPSVFVCDEQIRAGLATQRAHLHERGSTGALDVRAHVQLRARRAGFLVSAALVAWLNVLALVVALVSTFGERTADAFPAAILLFGPTVYSATLLRSNEHALVRTVLTGARRTLLFQLPLMLVSAALVTGIAGGNAAVRPWVIGLLVLVLGCATLLTFLARERRAQRRYARWPLLGWELAAAELIPGTLPSRR